MSLIASRLTLELGRRRVLDGIDAAFARGRVMALLGPNGAGKSSLLACLSGLRVPNAGSVLLDEAPLAGLQLRERARRIGLLPQSGDVHWNIDVRTLAALGRLPHRGRWGESAADRQAIDRAMAATDVAALADRGAGDLSGGERGRVLLARVLAGEPEWLLADEPLANLDPAHQIDVLDRLRDVARGGAGVIVVLHDLDHAARVADDVLLVKAGRVVAAGTAGDVLSPATIAETFGVRAEVGRAADGRRTITVVGRA